MNNIHHIDTRTAKRVTHNPSYFKKLTNADAAMNVLRLEMYKHDYKALAEKVGVSKGCIMAIRSGRTKWPRPNTFFGLLRELDLEMYLVPKGR